MAKGYKETRDKNHSKLDLSILSRPTKSMMCFSSTLLGIGDSRNDIPFSMSLRRIIEDLFRIR